MTDDPSVRYLAEFDRIKAVLSETDSREGQRKPLQDLQQLETLVGIRQEQGIGFNQLYEEIGDCLDSYVKIPHEREGDRKRRLAPDKLASEFFSTEERSTLSVKCSYWLLIEFSGAASSAIEELKKINRLQKKENTPQFTYEDSRFLSVLQREYDQFYVDDEVIRRSEKEYGWIIRIAKYGEDGLGFIPVAFDLDWYRTFSDTKINGGDEQAKYYTNNFILNAIHGKIRGIIVLANGNNQSNDNSLLDDQDNIYILVHDIFSIIKFSGAFGISLYKIEQKVNYDNKLEQWNILLQQVELMINPEKTSQYTEEEMKKIEELEAEIAKLKQTQELSGKEHQEFGRLRKEKEKWDLSIKVAARAGVIASTSEEKITRPKLWTELEASGVIKNSGEIPDTTFKKIWDAIPQEYRNLGGRPSKK